jgi:hypothetical protein
MKATFVHPAIRRSTAGIVTTIVIWAAVLSCIPLSVAFAQNAATSGQSPPATREANPPPSATDARGQAPVGHRQPRPSDVPPTVSRDEGGRVRSPVDQELDQKMQICRNC